MSLPYPPSANRAHRAWRGRVVPSSEARAYRRRVESTVLALGVATIRGPVRLAGGRRVQDVDNGLEQLLDALQGAGGGRGGAGGSGRLAGPGGGGVMGRRYAESAHESIHGRLLNWGTLRDLLM